MQEGIFLIESESNMTLTPTKVFNSLSNKDLIAIAEAGELNNFCNALTLDIASHKNEKITTYEA